MLETIWIIFRSLLAIYVGVGVILFLFQSSMIYYPELPGRKITATPAAIGLKYEEVILNTEDGLKLHGWYTPAESERGVVLFFHGNAGNISHRLDSLRIFNALGYSSFIFDYRGYGRSEGKPSEKGTYLDAEAAWRYLVEQRRIASQTIVFFGRSIGASVAAYLATRQLPKALILESAFTSVGDFAASIYPVYPTRLMARYRYNTSKYLESVECPLLIIHSRQDEIVPYKFGQRLYEQANEPKRMLTISGGHNDGFLISGKLYTTGIDDFLTSIGNR